MNETAEAPMTQHDVDMSTAEEVIRTLATKIANMSIDEANLRAQIVLLQRQLVDSHNRLAAATADTADQKEEME